MRWIRYGAAIAVIAFAAIIVNSLRQACDCNVAKVAIKARTERLEKEVNPVNLAQVARSNIAQLRHCTSITPADVDLYLLLGANYTYLQRKAETVTVLREALRYDKRPEILFNLGLTEIDLGQRAAAIRDLTEACSFNVNLYLEITSDGYVRQVVLDSVKARQQRIMSTAGGK